MAFLIKNLFLKARKLILKLEENIYSRANFLQCVVVGSCRGGHILEYLNYGFSIRFFCWVQQQHVGHFFCHLRY